MADSPQGWNTGHHHTSLPHKPQITPGWGPVDESVVYHIQFKYEGRTGQGQKKEETKGQLSRQSKVGLLDTRVGNKCLGASLNLILKNSALYQTASLLAHTKIMVHFPSFIFISFSRHHVTQVAVKLFLDTSMLSLHISF